MTNTEDSTTEHKSRAGAYVAYVLIALVLYVLSIGPAVWLNAKGYLPDEIGIVYFPLEYLYENTFLREPIEWYLELWNF